MMESLGSRSGLALATGLYGWVMLPVDQARPVETLARSAAVAGAFATVGRYSARPLSRVIGRYSVGVLSGIFWILALHTIGERPNLPKDFP